MDPAKAVAEMGETIDKFKTTQTELLNDIKATTEGSSAEVKAAVAKAEEGAKEIKGIAAQIVDIEQKMTQATLEGKAPIHSLGEMVIQSDAFKNYAGSANGRMVFKADITGQEGGANSDTIVAPDRRAGIVEGASRLLRIEDALMHGTTTSSMIKYTRELLLTNAAATKAQGAASAKSDITFELVNDAVAIVATHIDIAKEVMEDAPMLQSYIDTRLKYMVDYKCEQQILNGDGTGQNISGMLNAGNFTAFTPGAGVSSLDNVNVAMYDVYGTDYAPTHYILNPADWGVIERIKRGTDDAAYVFGNPNSSVGAVLWGLPVILSNSMPQGSFAVGALDMAFQVWDRKDTTISVYDQHGTNATEGMLTLQGENRKALASYRPASFHSGLLVAA